MQRVLVTGMSGLIGSAVRRRLEGRYQLFALNRREVPGIPTFRADIGDIKAILPAFQGMDAVVHLAASLGGDDQWESLLRVNIVGTYNVFEAARRANVRRVVFASSGAVVANYELDEPFKALVEGRYQDVPARWPIIDHNWPVRPWGLYGCTKVWGEVLARYYVDTFGLSILCLRIGHVTREDRPTNIPRDYTIWCSQRDVAQMVERCLEAPPDLRYALFFVTSNNRWGYRDLEYPRRLVGFVPEDGAEAFRPRSG
jgi:uronate dehydrogenase